MVHSRLRARTGMRYADLDPVLLDMARACCNPSGEERAIASAPWRSAPVATHPEMRSSLQAFPEVSVWTEIPLIAIHPEMRSSLQGRFLRIPEIPVKKLQSILGWEGHCKSSTRLPQIWGPDVVLPIYLMGAGGQDPPGEITTKFGSGGYSRSLYRRTTNQFYYIPLMSIYKPIAYKNLYKNLYVINLKVGHIINNLIITDCLTL